MHTIVSVWQRNIESFLDSYGKIRFIRILVSLKLASAPRLFTKLLKPVFATLRRLGHVIIGYIDDSLLIGNCIKECLDHVSETLALVESLGFVVNYEKSVLTPSTKIIFLGNVIDSELMIVYLTEERKESILEACKKLQTKSREKIREVAKVIGLVVASFSAVEFGQLFYRDMERAKTDALVQSQHDYDAFMFITKEMKLELDWWISNISSSVRRILHEPYDLTITSDASHLGWGAVMNELKSGGRWTTDESENHINYLELLACFFGLKCFCSDVTNKYVKLFMDNTTAISYINNMGGISSKKCDKLAKEIWLWSMNRDLWLSAWHIPGKDNLIADMMSRKFDDQIEWMLSKSVFHKIVLRWGQPEIDLFATRLNKQIDVYCSWHPDPDARYVNAFSFSWANIYGYLNPPFSLIGRVVRKICQDQAECVLVAPVWPTQPWFNRVLEKLVDHPVILPVMDNLLTLPGTDVQHPLKDSLVLMACRLSGCSTKNEEFLIKQPRSFWHHGSREPRNNIKHFIRDVLGTNKTAVTAKLRALTTNMDQSYTCKKESTFNIQNGISMVTKDLHFQAFKTENSTAFSAAVYCKDSGDNYILLISTGAALGGLLLLVIVAVIVFKKRQSYEQLTH
ncbi:uncharacterized protein LOC134257519 [Saccostrea cucullata]|uniref:uncharacterized protein LOC134257519 n=1 Tax=Saccostrea cuccullata TaxID=36930 RepID=UPI002ED66980